MNSRTYTELDTLKILLLLGIQAVLLSTLVISNGSLWVDEFGTARIADVSSFGEWWQQFSTWFDSDIQMPLYHFYIFLWGRIFGLSEYAMRMSNLPLFLLAEAALLWTFRRDRVLALAIFLVSTFHPLLWYYLNEARPYVMLYLAATLALCGLIRLYAAKIDADGGGSLRIADHSPWLLSAGILLLAGTSLLGVPWAGLAVVVTGYFYATGRRRFVEELLASWRAHAVVFFGLATLGSFYLYTLLRGARATELYQSDIRTLIFSGYELLGLSGLGPGRLALRSDGVAALDGWMLALSVGSVFLALGICCGLRSLHLALGTRKFLLALSAVLVPIVSIAGIGFALHWRVVGRHFMPVLPVTVFLLAIGISTLYQSKANRVRGRLLSGLVLGTIVFSGVSMKAARHENADFRGAATLSSGFLQSSGVVWWAGYRLGALHYGLSFNNTLVRSGSCPELEGSSRTRAVLVNNLSRQCLDLFDQPELIVLSDPQIYDRHGGLTEWIAESNYVEWQALSAFTLWRPAEIN